MSLKALQFEMRCQKILELPGVAPASRISKYVVGEAVAMPPGCCPVPLHLALANYLPVIDILNSTVWATRQEFLDVT